MGSTRKRPQPGLQQADLLSEPARRAAEAAAVIGSEVALEVLETVNGSDEGIDALLESGMVAERSPGLAAFASPRERDALYAAVPWTRRRTLHRRAAESLEARRRGAAEIADHWLAAGEPGRARRVLVECAARAREAHKHDETVRLLRRALDAWTPGEAEDERLAALEQLGDAAQSGGLLADALLAWREVADSSQQAVRGRALRKLANLCELGCDWARSVELRQDAMSAFEAAGEPAEAAVEGITAAIRLRLSARHAAGLEVLERAAADADASGREDLRVRVAALTGNLQSRLGRYAEGIPKIRAALNAALALDQPALAGEIYQRLADAVERTSDFASGAAVDREGVSFCEGHDAAGGIVGCLACMAWILVRGGEWDQAAAACRRILGSSACAPPARAVALGLTGLVPVLRGERKKGEPLLLEADALARRLEHALMELITRWGLALCDSLAHDDKAAAERCRGILARQRKTDEMHSMMPILRWSAGCFARVGDRDGLRQCADIFSEAAAAFSHAEPLSALAHVLGECAWLEGDVARAAEQFGHAVALLEDMQLPRERVESQLRAAAACAALGRREEAVSYARDAARGAERLGARPLFDEAAQHLRTLGEALSGALGPRGARRAEHAGLTARQLQVLGEISRGRTDKEIARALRLSPRTVEMHVAHALAALDCRSRAEAVRKAGELGVLDPRVP
jgi:DNA-binding NarL/FixJ family response regulator